MSTVMTWQITSTGSADTQRLGELLGSKLSGGEVIELASDLGGGKTTFTQGLARGLESHEHASSPTFTLNKVYKAKDNLEIHHFDFYRLSQAGIMKAQLAESVGSPHIITVVEWSGIVQDVLPADRLRIKFEPTANDPDERQITITYTDEYEGIIKEIETGWQEIKP